jgi:hypothetical protein
MLSASLYSLEAGDALCLENLHGVGLERIVTRKAFVKADNALGSVLGHGADRLQRERSIKTEEERATRYAVYRLAGKLKRLDWRRERETALE